MLEAGADPEAVTLDRRTAADLALAGGHGEVVRFLESVSGGVSSEVEA